MSRRSAKLLRVRRALPESVCHEQHKELSMGAGVVVGASCWHPRPGYDIYVGLDVSMAVLRYAPWRRRSEVAQVHFPIRDGGAPADVDVEEFKLLVVWLAEALLQGKRLHIGCIGGHGRTGLVLAALRCVVHGDLDSIQWVRHNHCERAVETSEQVAFLSATYGIRGAAGSRHYSMPPSLRQSLFGGSVKTPFDEDDDDDYDVTNSWRARD